MYNLNLTHSSNNFYGTVRHLFVTLFVFVWVLLMNEALMKWRLFCFHGQLSTEVIMRNRNNIAEGKKNYLLTWHQTW
jgi:hypothetical protein